MLGSRIASCPTPVLARAAVGALALLPACADTSEVARPRQSRATVTYVSDGDTIRLAGLGRVRLIGIDTPEVHGRVECFGPAAARFVRRLLPAGTPVRYRLGGDPRDRYGRVLAYVWLPDGRFLNELLVSRGYAEPLSIAPNLDYARRFEAKAGSARRARRGLWGRPGCAAPAR